MIYFRILTCLDNFLQDIVEILMETIDYKHLMEPVT